MVAAATITHEGIQKANTSTKRSLQQKKEEDKLKEVKLASPSYPSKAKPKQNQIEKVLTTIRTPVENLLPENLPSPPQIKLLPENLPPPPQINLLSENPPPPPQKINLNQFGINLQNQLRQLTAIHKQTSLAAQQVSATALPDNSSSSTTSSALKSETPAFSLELDTTSSSKSEKENCATTKAI